LAPPLTWISCSEPCSIKDKKGIGNQKTAIGNTTHKREKLKREGWAGQTALNSLKGRGDQPPILEKGKQAKFPQNPRANL